MKFPRMHVRVPDRERIIWLLAAGVLIAGYYFITQKYERTIQMSLDRSQGLHEKIATDRRMIAQSGQALRLRTRLRRTLSGVMAQTAESQIMATLLRDLDYSARAHHIVIFAISPHARGTAAQSAHSGGADQGDPGPLKNSALDLSARGTFSDLLTFVARLPREHVLLQVQDVQFNLSSVLHDPKKPLLDAKVHVLLYQVTTPQVLGDL